MLNGWFRELYLSLEEANPATAVRELEYMFFFCIADPKVLEGIPTKAKQEQWQLLINKSQENLKGGIIRVRKSVSDDGVQFTQTYKLFDSEPGRDEIEHEVAQEIFEAHRALCGKGQSKTRYSVAIDGTDGLGPGGSGLVWEIDVFRDSEGKVIPWVKVDLEVARELKEIPKFPFDHTHAILNQRGQRTEAEDAQVRKLLDDEYCSSHQEAEDVSNNTDSNTEITSA